VHMLTSIHHPFKRIAGPAGFSSGIGARALSNGINSAVFFCFFEAIRNGMQANAHLQAADVVRAWAAQVSGVADGFLGTSGTFPTLNRLAQLPWQAGPGKFSH